MGRRCEGASSTRWRSVGRARVAKLADDVHAQAAVESWVVAPGAGKAQAVGGSSSSSGCFLSQGTGQAETCTFSTGAACVTPNTPGTCPSGFGGCCGQTIDGISSYACYYDPTVVSEAKSACTSPDMWVTSLR